MYFLLILSFSLFPPPLPDSIRFNGVIEGFVKYSYASPARYFLDFGHYDVARAEGIAGFYLNPASLYKIDTLEVGITAQLPRSSHTEIGMNLSDDILFPFGFSIPMTIKAKELGALDFFFIAAKSQKVGIGFGIMQADIYDISFSGGGNSAAAINVELDDSLTHSEIPDIPPGEAIPIRWVIKGEEILELMMEGKGRLEVVPFFLGIAYDFDRAGVGLSFKWIRYNTKGNFNAKLKQTISNLDMMIEDRSSDWTADIQVEGKGGVDSIWTDNSWDNFSAIQPAISLGTQFGLGNFEIGLAIEHQFRSRFRGDHKHSSATPTDLKLPEITFAITSVDITEKHISGEIKADFGGWEKDEENKQGDAFFSLPSQTSLRLGASARLPLTVLSSSFGMQMIGLGDGIGEFYFSTGMEYLFRFPIRVGFIINWKLHQIGNIMFSTFPIMGLGIGTSFPFEQFSFDLALRMGSTPFPVIIDPLTSLSIGGGIRYHF